jgi:hypothetical protein
MVLSPVYGNCYVGNDLNFPEWGIEEARGIRNCGHRYIKIIMCSILKIIQTKKMCSILTVDINV